MRPRTLRRRLPRIDGGLLNPPSFMSVVVRMGAACAGVILVVLCGGCEGETTLVEPSPTPMILDDGDDLGPTIEVEAVEDGQLAQMPVSVEARITDASGIAEATLYYRGGGSSYWGSAALEEQGEVFRGEIPAAFVGDAGVDYYVSATDRSVNRNTSMYPPEGPAAPLHFSTRWESVAFPYVEDFEADGSSGSLDETGWTLYVEGFDDGENWLLTDREAFTGGWSVTHGHGSPYQTEGFDDWLVSPPIDLSQVDAADLYWWERSAYASLGDHRLLVSTGSPNPADGEYIVVYDPLPEAEGSDEGWRRSIHVDLTPWVGESALFVAFTYEGLWADDWWIDSLHIEPPAPDLVIDAGRFEPAAIDPGGSASLTFSVENEGLAASGPLVAVFGSPDAGVRFEPSSLDLSSIGAGEAVEIGPVTVSVDDDHADDTWVDCPLTLSNESVTWTGVARLQLGTPPRADITITHTFEDDLQVYLGYGDPSSPTWRVVVQEDEGGDASGTFSWSVDLSDARDAFPPDSADNQWFLEVWDDSTGNTGTIDAFSLHYGDGSWVADAVPRDIPDDTTSTFVFIPDQASFQIRSFSPEATEPGAEVALEIDFINSAGPPTGTLAATLEADEAPIHQLTPSSVAVDYTAYEESRDGVFGEAVLESPFTFQVDAGVVDSSPIELVVVLRDDRNEWRLPFSIRVPYPVLGGLGLTLEDDDDGDGRLDPGEEAGLRLRIRNEGELETFGPVTATLSVLDAGRSGAVIEGGTVDMLLDDGSFAPIPAGGRARGDDGLLLSLSGGEIGDEILLEIDATDGEIEQTRTLTLVLGDAPWNPILSASDPLGDASGRAFDLDEGAFQIIGTTLTLRWSSHYPFDIEDTFLYAYLAATNEYRYAVYVSDVSLLYRWYQSGEGYWYRQYSQPQSLSAAQISDDEVEIVVDLEELSLTGGELFGGASVGSCEGGATCDDAPPDAALNGGLTPFWW